MPRRTSTARVEPALHANTATKIRDKYKAIWGQNWPHDDRYLNQLWFKAGDKTDRMAARYEVVLNTMRECDDTIPAEYGRVV